MTHQEVVSAIGALYPGIEWSYDGDGSSLGPVYDEDGTLLSRGLEWPDTNTPAPTMDDLQQGLTTATATVAAADLQAAWDALRQIRNKWLALTDFIAVYLANGSPADMPQPISTAITKNGQTWIAFRQQLRDLPQNTPDPTATQWPAPPAQPPITFPSPPAPTVANTATATASQA